MASTGQKTGEPSWEAVYLPWEIPWRLQNNLLLPSRQSRRVPNVVVQHLQKRYEEKKRGIRILGWKALTDVTPARLLGEPGFRVATPKKRAGRT